MIRVIGEPEKAERTVSWTRKGRAGDWENRQPVVSPGLDWWEVNSKVRDVVGTARLGLRVTGRRDVDRERKARMSVEG